MRCEAIPASSQWGKIFTGIKELDSKEECQHANGEVRTSQPQHNPAQGQGHCNGRKVAKNPSKWPPDFIVDNKE